jgi:NADH:ubiquinone reductase (H+-translocating)
MSHLLIIGGGYAGMWASLAAAAQADRHGGDVDIALVSRDGYLTNRPRLYEANPAALRDPLGPSLEPAGVRFVEGDAESIDTANRTVILADGSTLAYDRLILAAGSVLGPLLVPGYAEHAWNIDSYHSAVALDAHLGRTLAGPAPHGVVIIGGGFTGIELAAEMRQRIADHGGRAIADAAHVVLIDRDAAIGSALGDNPRPIIEAALAETRVDVMLNSTVAAIDGEGVTLADGARIPARTTIVTTGMRASGLAAALGVETDRLGRLPTDDMLRVAGIDHVYAAGDMARAYVDDENLALMSCQHALTMGRFAGYNAARDLMGLSLEPYRQPRYVTCLDLGASGALFTQGWDRKIDLQGSEAKALKRSIVTDGIAPPRGSRAEILAAAAIDA